ncbi:MAG: phosphodiesterase [Rhodospirillales bacterium]|nr:phosphodiesterase [Rhodospirillales bacterium]
MTKLVHLSDLHFVPPGERLYGLDPLERLQSCISSINNHHPDADLCILTGDLADAGSREAYQLLKTALSDLCIPYMLLLGNHDDRRNFTGVFGPAVAAAGFVQAAMDLGDIKVLSLDTLEPSLGGGGTLCQQRLSWLDEMLATYRNDQIVIAMHHPPFDPGIAHFDTIQFHGSNALADVLQKYEGIRHVMFGHVHVAMTRIWRGISCSSTKGPCHQIRLEPANPCASFIAAPPSYALIVIDDSSVTVHQVDAADDDSVIFTAEPDPPL